MNRTPLIISAYLLVLASCSPKAATATLSIGTVSYLQTTNVKLSNTQVRVDSTFFMNAAQVVLEQSVPKGTIHYKINQEDNETYTTPLSISATCTIDSYVTRAGYIGSDTVRTAVVKVNSLLETATVQLQTPAHETYPGRGATSMTDHVKGKLAFRSTDSWCGFDDSLVVIDVILAQPTAVKAVTVSMLSDHGAWIFGPERITIVADGEDTYAYDCPIPIGAMTPHYDIVRVPIPAVERTHLRIQIRQLAELPEWHAGAGSSPWLFIDEIIIE